MLLAAEDVSETFVTQNHDMPFPDPLLIDTKFIIVPSIVQRRLLDGLIIRHAYSDFPHDVSGKRSCYIVDDKLDGPTLCSLSLLTNKMRAAKSTFQQVGFYAGVGRSAKTVDVIMFGAKYLTDPLWTHEKYGMLQPTLELFFANWDSEPGHTGITSLKEVGVAGTLRYFLSRHDGCAIRPFLEAGFGIHYLTEIRIEHEELGQHIQFGSKIGIGLTLGDYMDIVGRVRHLSNAGLSDPNWGINHVMLMVVSRF